jgi:hypothetical protein
VADSNADRQRRFRQHTAGKHELCRPESCEFAGKKKTAPLKRTVLPPAPETSTPTAIPVSEDGWGPAGTQLWRELEGSVPAAHLPLLREACRIVDRLDRLDGILQRKNDWLRVNTMDFGENVKVKITMDGVLAEARQQAATVHALIKDLAQFVKHEPKQQAKPGGLSDLSARIAARRGQSAG